MTAFGYFADRYRIRVIGAVIPSQTTQAQSSAGEVAKLSGVIRREASKAVFPESSLNAKLVRAIARQTGAKADYTLYGDTLGPRGPTARRTWGWSCTTPTRWCAASREGARGCAIGGL
jgi:ABC-type Zn uptake system ZnuABC Zn-binding protein ZnuA